MVQCQHLCPGSLCTYGPAGWHRAVRAWIQSRRTVWVMEERVAVLLKQISRVGFTWVLLCGRNSDSKISWGHRLVVEICRTTLAVFPSGTTRKIFVWYLCASLSETSSLQGSDEKKMIYFASFLSKRKSWEVEHGSLINNRSVWSRCSSLTCASPSHRYETKMSLQPKSVPLFSMERWWPEGGAAVNES